MFIIRKKPCGPNCSPACDCGAYLEIWNDVFMQYNRTPDGRFEPLAQKNVDTGMGLDRTICVLQGVDSVYDTELYRGAISKVEELSGKKYGESEEVTRAIRIVCDHVRAAVFMLGDEKGVTPSNVDQGYVLRRLIRRAVRFARTLGVDDSVLGDLATIFIDLYAHVYPELEANREKITGELAQEAARFTRTLQQGLKEFEKLVGWIERSGGEKVINGKTAFRLYDTFGYPLELTIEMAQERGFTVDVDGYHAAFAEHQAKSQAGSEQRFKGGLAESTDVTARLHTATHLLNAALRTLVDPSIEQRGSNITPERLRFDFNLNRKVTPEELKAIEDWVNAAIAADVEITCEEMTVDEAKAQGAVGIFTSKYGDRVKVYTMGSYSKEICGGPHAARTGELGAFHIQKEQASSAGVRRIRATVDGPKE